MADEAVIWLHDGPQLNACPSCGSTKDLWLMECAPGWTWTFVNGCGCWGFIHRKPDVPRETSTPTNEEA
jgi:hypothetical protein